MAAYYNEIDPYAAQWLRNLISAGHIASGDVDERSIVDVRPDDLRGYDQCHFFAGIGVWSLALRRAGVADTANVWTGSCPCQPFSAAGKGGGFDDERHLWPAFHHLIKERRPGVVVGEQVASKDGLAWLDLVQSDMEGESYAFGAVDMCSAGFGAPHIRQRLYWIGTLDHAADARRQAAWEHDGGSSPLAARPLEPSPVGNVADSERERGRGRELGRQDAADARLAGQAGELADTADAGCERRRAGETSDGGSPSRIEPERLCDALELANAADGGRREQRGAMEPRQVRHANRSGNTPRRLADANGGDASAERQQRSGQQRQQPEDSGPSGRRGVGLGHNCGPELEGPCPTNGFWRDADWLLCRDGKWRPVEPGTFPLAHGAPARVGRLRAYGNAINAEQATDFIRSIGLAG